MFSRKSKFRKVVENTQITIKDPSDKFYEVGDRYFKTSSHRIAKFIQRELSQYGVKSTILQDLKGRDTYRFTVLKS